jgi:hypothetical protein
MIGTPEYDEFVECQNPQCVHVGATIDTGFGVIGGGIGPYTYCANCGTLLTKSQTEELCESHEEYPPPFIPMGKRNYELFKEELEKDKIAPEVLAEIEKEGKAHEPTTDVSTGGQTDNKSE